MKKFLKIITGATILLIITLIIVPLLFKDQIIELVKKEANKNINATLDFREIGLDLFSNFPNFTLKIKDLSIINHEPFAGDTLAGINSFETTLDLMSVIRGNTIRIVAFTLDEPIVNLIVLEDSSANWDIQRVTDKQPADTEKSDLNLALQKYEIRKGRLSYVDRISGMSISAHNMDHTGSGDFTRDRFQLQTLTDMGSLTVTSGGIDYLNKVHTRLEADLDVNTSESKFTLGDNELHLNELILTFTGAVQSHEEDLALDVKFKAPNTEFSNVLSLIPAIYLKDFADLKSTGKIGLEGFVKGTYGEKDFPAFDVKLNVEDGSFQYATLPQAVNNVQVDLQIHNAGGDFERTIIDLRKFHLEIDKEAIHANLLIHTPMSDPEFSAALRGRLNFAKLKDAIPMAKDLELAGLIASNLQVEAKMSSIEKRDYGKVNAGGNVSFENFSYKTADLPQKIAIQQAQLAFSPARVVLKDLSATIGRSDLKADGTLENVLAFVLSGHPLKGNMSLTSTFFDLNPFLEGPGGDWSAVQLPANIELTLNSAFREVQYGQLKLQEMNGLLLLKDRTLSLMNLKMNILNGSMVANGSYQTQENAKSHFFFDLNIDRVSIPQTFEHFVAVQKFVPIARSMQGSFGARLEIVSDLEETLMPVWASFNSRGSLAILEASIKDFKPLNTIADAIKLDELKSLILKEINTSYKIRDGRFYLSPLKLRKENIDLVVSGSNGIDKSLDYALQLKLPANAIKQQTNAALTQLLNRKVDLLTDDSIVLNVSLRGMLDQPSVNLAMQDIIKGAADQAKSVVMQGLQEKRIVLEDSIRVEIDKQKKELERLKNEAEEKAKQEKERLKKEAEKKLKKLINR